MKILISAHTFYPNIGGIETFTDNLASSLVRLGHQVKVLTPVMCPNADNTVYPILRCPSPLELIEAFEWCDVFYQSNISLRLAWPLLLIPRPLVITHHIWLEGKEIHAFKKVFSLSFFKKISLGLKNFFKKTFYDLGTSIVVSHFLNTCFSQTFLVIHNPYKDDLFYPRKEIHRTQSLIFVGRLVEEKGVHCALKALSILKDQGITPHLTVVGEGKERQALEALVGTYGLTDTVHFAGPLEGEELAKAYCKHAIQLIPSLWAEPFGLVALEGIACDCVPIGSAIGGLTEAIGPCGIIFPNGDAQALSQCIQNLLNHPEKQASYRSYAQAHLAQFSAQRVVKRYLQVFPSKIDAPNPLHSF
jgi:glycogen(starch) synthase